MGGGVDVPGELLVKFRTTVPIARGIAALALLATLGALSPIPPLPTDEDLWRILFYSDSVHRKPNSDIYFAIYGYDSALRASARVHRNNLGFISNYDYDMRRKPGEFRIVALGGEQTASSVVNKSWPDYLWDYLRGDDRSRPYTVINCAWPDAGPDHYIRYWKDECSNFDPDLVIVNYREGDFYRTIRGTPLTIRGKSIASGVIDYNVGGVTVKINVARPADHPVSSLRDPLSIPSRPYGAFAPSSFVNDSERVRQLQIRIVSDMVAGGLPRHFDPLPSAPADHEKVLQFGMSRFGWIANNIPNVIIIHNFHYNELHARWALTDEMTKRDPSIKVIDPRRFIAADASDGDLKSWWMMGIMDHKFTERGMAGYARIIQKIVNDWRKARPF